MKKRKPKGFGKFDALMRKMIPPVIVDPTTGRKYTLKRKGRKRKSK